MTLDEALIRIEELEKENDEDFVVTSAPVQPETSAYDDLEKVAKLHEAGVLSDEEFNKMKADLLEKM